MLREEGQVDADEGRPEMDLAELVVLVSRHLADPVIEPGEQREHRAQRQHVMEMRDDVIGVVQRKSTPALASTTPVTPPRVNRKMKPMAHSIGVLNSIEPPHIVAIQEKIFTPVGTAMTIVAAVK